MAQFKPSLQPAKLLFQALKPIMFDLNSPHFYPEIVKLSIELLLHVRGLLPDLVFHSIAVKIFVR